MLAVAFPAAAQVGVTISPGSVNLVAGGSEQFSAAVTGTNNTAVNWSVLEGAQGGTVTSTGLYAAPPYAGAFHVVATSQADSSQSATAIAAVPGFLRPDMRNARSLPTVTQLQNGRILLTGGQDISGSASLATAEIYDPSTTMFTLTGSMAVTRQSQAAALLQNGQVLVAGGTPTGEIPTATAELYDPASGNFTLTGNMNTPRELFTATTLPNGQVLVAGGYFAVCAPNCVYSDTATAELYDPASGTFTSTGSMITARSHHAATLLPDGQVLIAGGNDSSAQALASTELYNPATGSFTAGPAMSFTTQGFSATLLANGNVLLAGGFSGVSLSGEADIYDSATNTISMTAGSFNFPRWQHTATLLSSGQVLITGGFGNYPGETSGAVPPAELYDPTTGTFATTGSLNQPRADHIAALLPNGTVLVAGGLGDLSVLDSAEIYDPVAGIFTTKDVLLKVQRAFHTQTQLSDGRVLITGGINNVANGTPAYASAEIYDPASGKFAFTGNMAAARQSHTATLLNNGDVLVVGGLGATTGAPLGSAELYGPGAGTFSLTGSLITPRSGHAASLLPNGQVLITGGQDSSGNNLISAELYDPAKGTFSSAGNMANSTFRTTSTLLNTGQVLIVSGVGRELPNSVPAVAPELFDPSTNAFSSISTGGFTNPALQTATLLPSGEVLIGNGAASLLYASGQPLQGPAVVYGLSPDNQRFDHAAALLLNGEVIMAGGLGFDALVSGGDNPQQLTSDLYDPVLNVLVQGDTMRAPRVHATASTLLDGNAMIVGGTDASTDMVASRSVEIYQSAQPATTLAITSITPSPLTGFNPVVITIQGSGFLPGAVASFDTFQLATTFVSASQLSAVVPASQMTILGGHQIVVANPGGQASSPFQVTVQNPGITISVEGNFVSFGSIPVGNQSSPQVIAVGSAGTLPLTLGPIAITGTNASDFSLNNATTCPVGGGTVPAGGGCNLSVTFSPSAPGTRTAQITASTNAQEPAVSITLAGTGNSSPGASLSVTSLSFGNQGVGTTSSAQPVTLINGGNSALSISGIALSSTTDYSISNFCPASLAAGLSCIVNVTFTPGAAGPRNATLTITDNAVPSGSQTVSLTGTGTIVSMGAASNGSTSVSVPSGQTATFNLQATAAGNAATTVSLTVNCASIPNATCSVNPASLSVNPTASTPFSVSVVTTPYVPAGAPILAPTPPVSTRLERISIWAAVSFLAILLGMLAAVHRGGGNQIRWSALSTVLAVLMLMAIFGCGGNSAPNPPPQPQGTPPGNYSAVVTVSSQANNQQLALSLTVQ
jgi:Abnormal spindle-like microcephaly-assoc'd, ASPM-SPD-2-Hydin/Galactose oxidase, central domain